MRCAIGLLTFLLSVAASPAVGGAAELRTAPALPPGFSRTAIRSDDSEPVLVPEPGEKAMRFYRSGNALWCVRAFWELFVPALILFSGFSARIRDRVERIRRNWYLTVALYVVSFMVVKYLLDFPLACYQEFFRQHAYGLSNQSFGRWLSHSLTRLGVEIVVGAAFLWAPYWLMRKSPRRWWLHAWMAATGAGALMVFLTPVWIDPLFNRFGPMKDKALEADILALASRAGIPGSRVYEVDKSADTKAVNAYVTGFMGTKRIVLWDTLIAKLDRRELLAVVGHEIGHYVLRHVLQGMFFGSALVLLGFYLFHRISGPLIERYRLRFGFCLVSDIASLPLILLFMSAGSLAVEPLVLAFSRHLEREADRFALEITRDNYAAATAEVKLQRENLGVPRPGPFYTLWRSSHPSVAERIEFANSYRPWTNGGAGKYEHLFSSPLKE